MSGFCLDRPAESWCEGALCGNGTLGAVVMGIPSREQIILSHEALFAPVFGQEKPIPMAEHLAAIRDLIKEGKYREAGSIPWKMFLEKYPEKLWTNPFLPAGDLIIETAGVSAYQNYQRSLDFETGTAEVSFASREKVYHRRVFASRVQGQLFAELSAGADNRNAAGKEKQENSAAEADSGNCAAEYLLGLEKHPYEDGDPSLMEGGVYHLLNGRTETTDTSVTYVCHYGESEDGYRIRLQIPAQDGVDCAAEGEKIRVRARGTVFLALSIEPMHTDSQEMVPADFDTALEAAVSVHKERMDRIRLHLEEENAYENDTALYQAARERRADAAFLNRIFDAGRYAILSSSGKLPPNLQGVWNGVYHVPWSSDYTQDGNLQTAILGTLPCGDFESMKSFFDYQESLMEDYRENSRILYGCRGIHVPTRTSDRGYDIHFDETWPMLFWTAGAGWNARFFYDYWLYTGDDAFFKEHALPFMKEAALFYEDYLIEDKNGKWLFTPGYSPENTPKGNDSSVAVNATMDISVARELFTNLISGCRTLGLEEEAENIRRWEQMLQNMPDYQINADGALKEWAFDTLEDEYDHRHISHLYLLFHDIPEEVRKDPILFEACRKAYEIKMERKKKEQGTMAFGLVLAGMVAAHLQDAEMTEILLQSLARNDYYPTFASSHDYGPNLFNVDISGGLPALMLECIAQSIPVLKEDLSIDHFEIRLLPALPDSMRSGSVDGLCLKGGFRLHMRWKNGAVEEYRLENDLHQKYVMAKCRNNDIPDSIQAILDRIKAAFQDEPQIYETFRNCYTDTLSKTIHPMEDGTAYVVTGDIPAMWLRDSSAQLRPYLIPAKEDKNIADLLVAVNQRQFRYICIDPYANAFNREPNGNCWEKDETEMNDWLWERKYEVDSLCYPIQFAYLIWKNTGRMDQFDDAFAEAVRRILQVFRTEQRHEEQSRYRFVRRNTYFTDTLSREGMGALVKSGTGMIWSGFRPSDDACTYGYLVPANMFAVVILGYLKEIAEEILKDAAVAEEAVRLREEIYEGIEANAVTCKEGYGDVYAYEVDGYGQFNLMDDANVPSLLSMNYLGYQGKRPQVAENTRKLILSEANPYYYQGKKAQGIGSPHTPVGYIWHIALCMQGLTAKTAEEKKAMIDLAVSTDGGKMLMHEGFCAEDDSRYTRTWFSWANAMFCELVMDYCGMKVQK